MRSFSIFATALILCAQSSRAQNKEDYDLVSGRLANFGIRSGYLSVTVNGKLMRGYPQDEARIVKYSSDGKRTYLTPYDVPNAARKDQMLQYGWLAVNKKSGKWKYLILGHDVEVVFDASRFPRPEMSPRPPMPDPHTWIDGRSRNGEIGKLSGRVMQIIDGNTCMITKGDDQPFRVQGVPTTNMRVNLRQNTTELDSYVFKVLGNKQYTGVGGAIKTATLLEPVKGKELTEYEAKVQAKLDQHTKLVADWTKECNERIQEWERTVDRERDLVSKKNADLKASIEKFLYEKNTESKATAAEREERQGFENDAMAEKDAKTLLDFAKQPFNAGDKEKARKQLEALIKKYPKTKAAADAKKLLDILSR